MAIIVTLSAGELLAKTEAELAAALMSARSDGDEVYLCGEGADYPVLAILISADYAHVSYRQATDRAGWVLSGNRAEIAKDAVFTIKTPFETYELHGDQLVGRADALAAARSFMRNPNELPPGLNWIEL